MPIDPVSQLSSPGVRVMILIAPAIVLVALGVGGAFWWRESHLCSGGSARWAAVWSAQRATKLTGVVTASGFAGGARSAVA